MIKRKITTHSIDGGGITKVTGHSPKEYAAGMLDVMQAFVDGERENHAKGLNLKAMIMIAAYIDPHEDVISNAMGGRPDHIVELCRASGTVIMSRIRAARSAEYKEGN
jgi:hypothetical protein